MNWIRTSSGRRRRGQPGWRLLSTSRSWPLTLVVLVCAAAGGAAGPSASAVTETCFGLTATAVGTSGDDTIRGSAGDDVIVVGDGNDHISGLEGDDVICGGSGDDVLEGGEGDDRLLGEAGVDRLDGGTGDFDRLDGGAGDDTLIGGPGEIDLLRFDNAPGPVVVDLTKGAATGDGTDQLSGIEASFGTDFSNDRLIGDQDSNYFASKGGDDYVDGGAGSDAVILSSPTKANLALGKAAGTDGTDTLVGVEGLGATVGRNTLIGDSAENLLIGGPGQDRLEGSGGDDWLYGYGGNDALLGGPGADLLVGGTGKDRIDGGEGGSDVLSYYDSNKGVHVDLGAGRGAHGAQVSGVEQVEGSPKNDRIYGSKRPDVLFGGSGKDHLYGLAGSDYLDGGGGGDDLYPGRGSDYCVNGTVHGSKCEAIGAPTTDTEPVLDRSARGLFAGDPQAYGRVESLLEFLDIRTAAAASARRGQFRYRLFPTCVARGGRFTTTVSPPSEMYPYADDGGSERVRWQATLQHKTKSGWEPVQQTEWASGDAGLSNKPAGFINWTFDADRTKDYPATSKPYSVPAGRYRWFGVIIWERSDYPSQKPIATYARRPPLKYVNSWCRFPRQ
jgi:Ca2+-binding RTX toxin-like protein